MGDKPAPTANCFGMIHGVSCQIQQYSEYLSIECKFTFILNASTWTKLYVGVANTFVWWTIPLGILNKSLLKFLLPLFYNTYWHAISPGQEDDESTTEQSRPLPKDLFRLRQMHRSRGLSTSQTGSAASGGSVLSGEPSVNISNDWLFSLLTIHCHPCTPLDNWKAVYDDVWLALMLYICLFIFLMYRW